MRPSERPSRTRLLGGLILTLLLSPAWRPADDAPDTAASDGGNGDAPAPARLLAAPADSVLPIEAETVLGRGFVADARGLLVACLQQAPRPSGGKNAPAPLAVGADLAVTVSADRRVRGVLVARESSSGLAVVRVAPDAIADHPPLRLAAETTAAPEVRATPIAGHPLVDRDGAVAAVPGFGRAGAIRPIPVPRVAALLKTGRAALEAPSTAVPPPSAAPLPARLPGASREAIVRAAQRPDLERDRHVDGGNFTVEVLTPALVAALQEGRTGAAPGPGVDQAKGRPSHRDAGVYLPERDFLLWQRYRGLSEPSVVIQVVPRMGKNNAMVADEAGSAALAVGLAPLTCGDSLKGIGGDIRYVFEPNFLALALLRDGVEVPPLLPGRVCAAFYARVLKAPDDTRFVDDIAGCYGAYRYPASAFAPGAALALRLRFEGQAEAIDLPLPEAVRGQAHADFESFTDPSPLR